MSSRSSWPPAVRPLIGVAISLAFLVATLTRLDFELVTEAWGRVELAILLLAGALSLLEVGVRALRWVVLLRPLAHPRLAVALGYLSIGHLANAVMPMRLGDVTRAYLAGAQFNASRVSVLGTIAVERIADAALLGLAAGAGVLIGYTGLAPELFALVLVGGAVVVAGLLVMIALDLEAVGSTRIAGLIRVYAGRFTAGAASLKQRRSLAGVAALTVISFALAIAIMHTTSVAVGLSLSVWQSALIVAAVTLSTAIPAGPASLGTYEFVGVSVMSSMGLPPEPSLLAVALMHAVATIVPSSMGLVAMWALGLRRIPPQPRGRSARDEPARGGVMAADTPELSVIVPAHNSSELITRSVAELAQRLEGRRVEIIVVENGSTDDTFARCGRLAEHERHPGISLSVLQSRKGMGNALRAGVLASRGGSVLLTADDLPFGFDDVDHLDRLTTSAAVPPVMIGSKAHPDSVVDRSPTRAALTWGFSLLVRAVLGMRTRDPQGTLILEGSLARELAQHAGEPGFLFTTELIYLSERVGVRPLELPVRLRASHHKHRSRIRPGDMIAMAIGLLRIRARHFRSRRLRPIRAHLQSTP